MKKRVVTFGEVMLRLSPTSSKRIVQAHEFDVTYAGAEANVASSCALFGFEAVHVTVLPSDEIGTAAIRELSSNGVTTKHIQRKEGRIGIYFYENAASLRSPKIIYDRFNSVFSEIEPGSVNWDEILQGADWFHWTGITPAVSAGAAAVCLEALKAAEKNNVCVSGDINYRRVLWKYGKAANEIMPELISYCDLIVGAHEDFKNCLHIDEPDFEMACNKVADQFQSIKEIVTTTRETISSSHHFIEGMMWTKTGLLHSKKYELLPIVDRVGSGDAFMAGLIYSKLKSNDNQSALEFATAACALKHTIPGDVNTVSAREVEDLMADKNTGKLLR
jgi:2-dehydro-3-deoxygluconokinase